MSTLSFEQVSYRELTRMSAAFAPGAQLVLGTERDGAGALVELATGLARPRSGRVTIDGKDPHTHAELRRSSSALFAEERLPEARTVAASLALALGARADARSAQSVLDQAGLASFAARRTKSLAARETRAVALALALSHGEPRLLSLFEPLSTLDILPEDFVLSSLRRAASAGAVVLATASRLEDATRLGGAIGVLERGVWLGARLPGLTTAALRVRTPEPRRLAARLAETPDVLALEWAGGRELVVRGRALEAVAAQVVAGARAEAIRIEALSHDPPSLEALAAARAGLGQAAYDRALRDASSQNPMPIFTSGTTPP